MGLFPLTNGLAMVNTAPIGVIGQLVGLRMVMPALGWTTLVLVLAIIAAMPAIRLVYPRSGAPPGATPVAAH